jgi:hypothetical protein
MASTKRSYKLQMRIKLTSQRQMNITAHIQAGRPGITLGNVHLECVYDKAHRSKVHFRKTPTWSTVPLPHRQPLVGPESNKSPGFHI